MSYNPQNPNGQANMANSAPVVIASDQSVVPVSGSVSIGANSSVNVAQVAGTATDVNSGLKSAGTQRVVLATDQPQLTNAFKVDGSAVTQPVSATTLPLPTGAATAANQTTANTSLGTIATNTGNIPAKGQATMANSTPVVLASDQSAVPVSLQAATTGSWSASSQTGLTNTVVSVKGSAGSLGGYMFYNPNAAVAYIQVFNVASGSVTLGTTTPTYVIPIPPAAAANVEFSLGINHTTAISAAATTTATGSTAPSTALTGFFIFK